MNIVSNRIYSSTLCPALGIIHILGEINLSDYLPNVAQAMTPQTLGNYQAKARKRKLFIGAMFGTDPRDFEIMLLDKDGEVLTRSIVDAYSDTGSIILDNEFVGADFDPSVLPRQAKYICMNRDGSWYWSFYEPVLLPPSEGNLDWDFLALSDVPPDSNKKRRQEMFFGPIFEGYEPRFAGSYEKSLFQISAEAAEGIVPIPAKSAPTPVEPPPVDPETPPTDETQFFIAP